MRAMQFGLVAIAALALTGAALGSIVIRASGAAFVDISVTGTSIGAIADDSETTVTGAALTAAGWAGNGLLAGNMSIRIGNNGSVIWGNSATDTFANATEIGYINSTIFGTMLASNLTTTGNGGSGPRQFLAVLWDDNIPGGGVGAIRWQVINGDLIIEWINEDHFNATGAGQITYEMIVRGGVTIASGRALVDFVYQDTQYAASQFQNDGGSATIGYKNWGLNAGANDVEFGTGGGTNTLGDPAFGDPSMRPKVAGYIAADNPALPHAVSIYGPCRVDYDLNGLVQIPDIFADLTGWFLHDPRADWNNDAVWTIGDFFQFLTDWFIGCP